MGLSIWLTWFTTCICGQEATVRREHTETECFPISKGVRQGCILPPYLYSFYAEHIIWKVRVKSKKVGVKTSERNINNIRYTDDIILLAESSNDLKGLLIKTEKKVPKQDCTWTSKRQKSWLPKKYIIFV